MKVLKVILIISAFLGVALRLLAYENAATLGEETTELFNIIGIASCIVCLVVALILVIIMKKTEKKEKEENKEEEQSNEE